MPLVPPKKRGTYTVEEVAGHNHAKSLWVIMNRKVYDVTAFQQLHPGGAAVLVQMGGKDATAAATAAHKSALPANLMWEFCIGSIVRSKPAPEVAVAPPPPPKALRKVSAPQAIHTAASAPKKAVVEEPELPQPTEDPMVRQHSRASKNSETKETMLAMAAATERSMSPVHSDRSANQGSSKGSSRDEDFAAQSPNRDTSPPKRRTTRGHSGKSEKLPSKEASGTRIGATEAEPEAEVRAFEEIPPEPSGREAHAVQAAGCAWPPGCQASQQRESGVAGMLRMLLPF